MKALFHKEVLQMNSTRFKNIIMGNIFRTDTSVSIPTNYYIGLSSTEPNVGGTNVTEPSSSTGYGRVRLTSLSAPNDGIITNTSVIQFNESTANWFTASNPATHYVIFDAPTGGNLLMYNKLTTSRVIETDTIATIKANTLYIELSE
jgi:hypothetical protein